MFIPPRYKCDNCQRSEEAEWAGQPHWDIPLRWSEVNNEHFCEECNTSVNDYWISMFDQQSEWLTFRSKDNIYRLTCPRYGRPDVKMFRNNTLIASFTSTQEPDASDKERKMLAKLWANEWIKEYD